ncbi:MAG: hypothetical protein GYA40_06155 [Chloroflexi bacterium]|nr:hypothetical protein [Chloroflexota bacterium]
MEKITPLLSVLLWVFLWSAGGFLILINTLKTQRHESALLGLGLGFVLQVWLANLTGRLLAPVPAFWLSAGIVFAVGLALTLALKSWQSARQALYFPPGQWLAFFALLYAFFMIGRGLAIFDDYQNLPVTSMLASGVIPPRFPLNPALSFDYHYLLLLNAAQWMRVGGFLPWTALDFARALCFSLAVLYAFLLGQRLTHSKAGGWLSALFTAFAGGMRWLLLFLPGRLLSVISERVTMIGSGLATDSSLKLALSKPWAIEGGGPFPFPFAYGSGFHTPAVMEHDGTGLMGLVIALLIILFFEQWKRKGGMLVVAALLAAQAMTDEIWFVFFLAALVLVLIVQLIRPGKTPRRQVWLQLLVLALVPGVLALVQGGVLTGAAAGIISRLGGVAAAASTQYFSLGFHLRFPPAFISSHLGALSLTNWGQALAAIAEVGPIFLLLPLFVVWGLKGYRAGRTIYPVLALGAVASFLTIFVEYEGAAGISATKRLTLYSSVLLTLFTVPLLWYWLRNKKEALRFTVIGLCALSMVGSLVYFAVESTAAQVPQESYYLDKLDTAFYQKYWNALEPEVMVFDLIPSRAATVFARPLESNQSWYAELPEYSALASSMAPRDIRAAGYQYIYLGSGEWDDFSPAVQAALSESCVSLVDEVKGENGAFRRLLDISACQ